MPNTAPAVEKIEYGLCNVYYAIATYDDAEKTYTYSTPVHIPGAVSLNLSPSGDSNPFYADNIVYFNTKTNAGYSGDLVIALIPEQFRIDVLGEEKRDGVLYEGNSTQGKEIALMFQFENDVSGRRFILYRCSVDRPSIESSTRQESTEPNTSTLSITAMARENDGIIKGAILYTEENKTKYNNWFTAVQQPEAAA